eukprot:TRINITY_DN9311_c0_g1_i1.p1 TRINITY_DN9311_c0_g1~~TRINITY_DN9311_c0_g1_i1.p1  ORF type:complete len:269 (+),score=31.99 TRINITY_DN9311_c0_g1_i1:115-921(+)
MIEIAKSIVWDQQLASRTMYSIVLSCVWFVFFEHLHRTLKKLQAKEAGKVDKETPKEFSLFRSWYFFLLPYYKEATSMVSVTHSFLVLPTSFICLWNHDYSSYFAMFSVCISLGYFLYDLYQAVYVSQEGWAMNAHHVISIIQGLSILILSPQFIIYFVWPQTNECSTPFLHHWNDDRDHRYVTFAIFGLLFLFSRVIVNSVVLILWPMQTGHINDVLTWIQYILGLAYLTLQYFWFLKLIYKLFRKITGRSRKPAPNRSPSPSDHIM